LETCAVVAWPRWGCVPELAHGGTALQAASPDSAEQMVCGLLLPARGRRGPGGAGRHRQRHPPPPPFWGGLRRADAPARASRGGGLNTGSRRCALVSPPMLGLGSNLVTHPARRSAARPGPPRPRPAHCRLECRSALYGPRLRWVRCRIRTDWTTAGPVAGVLTQLRSAAACRGTARSGEQLGRESSTGRWGPRVDRLETLPLGLPMRAAGKRCPSLRCRLRALRAHFVPCSPWVLDRAGSAWDRRSWPGWQSSRRLPGTACGELP